MEIVLRDAAPNRRAGVQNGRALRNAVVYVSVGRLLLTGNNGITCSAGRTRLLRCGGALAKTDFVTTACAPRQTRCASHTSQRPNNRLNRIVTCASNTLRAHPISLKASRASLSLCIMTCVCAVCDGQHTRVWSSSRASRARAHTGNNC